MKIAVEKLPKSLVKFRVEVPADDVLPYLERAARELSREHTPKGFRAGSAPLAVMRATVGDAALVERALKPLVQGTYVEVLLAREDIEAVGPPEVEVETTGFESPVTYTATVAVLPEVTLGPYLTIRAAQKAVTVEPQEVDRELEVLRRLRASYLTVPRPAQRGDRVEVDILGAVDRVPLAPGKPTRQSFLLSGDGLIPGFEVHLTGMREGETKNFALTFPPTHHRADLRGKTVDFTVTMRTIQQPLLPALDDHFARGLGKFASLQDLREQLTANLRAEKEHRERERYQQALLEEVVARGTVGELPDILVERELDLMLEELQEGVAGMGLDFPTYLGQIKKSPPELRAGLRTRAVHRVTCGLVLRALAKVEGIVVTDEEVEGEVNDFLKRFPSVTEAEKRVNLETLREVARGTIRNRKVFGRLEEIAAGPARSREGSAGRGSPGGGGGGKAPR